MQNFINLPGCLWKKNYFFSIILPEVGIFFENNKVASINFSYKLGLTFKWTFKSKFQLVAGSYVTDLIIFKIYIYFW